MDSQKLVLDGYPISPTGTPIAAIRERLATLPLFSRYADQVDAVLGILDSGRPWLPRDTGPVLCGAAFAHNDEIVQFVEGYSPRVLVWKVQEVSGLSDADDFHAIVAFALGSSLGAVAAIAECLRGEQGQELAALGLYRTYLDSIAEWLPEAAANLDAAEWELCEQLAEMAATASRQAEAKANGVRGGITRRGAEGIGPRDQAIMQKALELIRAGTRFHNLNSKLRAWQQRETGEALSKPAMGAVLQRLGLSLSDGPVNQRVNQAKK
ncbi:hypothetical protein ACSEN6_22570 [Pseudomonas aeruginosa]